MINLCKSYIDLFSKNMLSCLKKEKRLKLIIDYQFKELYMSYTRQRGINN